VRWSPDSETVALGCADAVLYLYGATDKFDLVAAAKGHLGMCDTVYYIVTSSVFPIAAAYTANYTNTYTASHSRFPCC
jgi:hypothetical protein